MSEPADNELLAEFARSGSEAAFAALVGRHVNLVYSAALRFTGNPNHADEITQAVFVVLARKAGSLGRSVVLSGWLYQTARLTAANFVRSEIRRQRREQEAVMQSALNKPDDDSWSKIAPLLDEAMGGLGHTERTAIVLRYFENKTAAEIAAALKLTEGAVHKRVARALEKLRKMFTRRGVVLSAALIAGALSAYSVQAAPTALSATISATAAKGAAAASILTLGEATLKTLAWAKLKIAAGFGVAALLAGGTATIIIADISAPPSQLDPIAMLKQVAAARAKIDSGEMEFIVARHDPKWAIHTNYSLLKVAFDGEKGRFEQLQREAAYPWTNSAAVEARIQSGEEYDDLARLGLLELQDAHYRTIYDGKSLMQYDPRMNATLDDPRKGSPEYLFDPRIFGLSDALAPEVTVDDCLGYRGGESVVSLVGKETVGDVAAWHIHVQVLTNWAYDFWIDASHPTHVIHQKAPNRDGEVFAKYDERHPEDPLPLETYEIAHLGGDPRPSEYLMTRINTRYNVSVDPKAFTMAGLDMPAGAEIFDRRLSRRIGYWTGNDVSQKIAAHSAAGVTHSPAVLDNTVQGLLQAKTDPSFVNERRIVLRRATLGLGLILMLFGAGWGTCRWLKAQRH